jgi:hypothetical protein
MLDPMTDFRTGHTVTVLQNGKVLVAGGDREGNATSRSEIYDPSTGSWTNAALMTVPRGGHTATLLPNGKVLIAGGDNTVLRVNPGLQKLTDYECNCERLSKFRGNAADITDSQSLWPRTR